MLQLGQLMSVLDKMAASRKWDISGELKIAGALKREHFTYSEAVEGFMAQAFYADTVSVGGQAALVRTHRGCTRRYDSTKEDQWVFVPFMKGPVHAQVFVPCALHVEQLLLVEACDKLRAELGWSEWEGDAKIATGTLYECSAISNPVIGLVDDFNDDSDVSAIRFPTIIRATVGTGYKWAVHIKQFACPLCFLGKRSPSEGRERLLFATIRKTGFHG